MRQGMRFCLSKVSHGGRPHPIQTAFIEEQAAQCGYCISGPMLYGKAFIDQNPTPRKPTSVMHWRDSFAGATRTSGW
jgi:aerobic-type carbon monoxide dehydrogenase small subunit (CoxS/CutS family)